MEQRTNETNDSQQPPSDLGGTIDPSLLNTAASTPAMAAVNNGLVHLPRKHAQPGQTPKASSGPAPPTGQIPYQRFEDVCGDGHLISVSHEISMCYDQYAAMTDNASPMTQYMTPGSFDPRAMFNQAGGSQAYGSYNMNMNQMVHGGLQQPGSSAGPAIPSTNPKEQQKRKGKKSKRWTPQMDARLDSLKASNQTHENIARILENEFPSAEGLEPLNNNIVTKRLKELRETAGPANAIEKCVNRWVPRALPVLEVEVARMIEADGPGDLESVMAEVELELRGQSRRIFQNVLLRRRRAKEAAAAAGPGASHASARVTKPTGRNGGRPRGLNHSNALKPDAKHANDFRLVKD